MNCLFCRIANKEISSQIVDENDNFVAIKDINPQAPTHILILPKKHIASVLTTENGDKEILGELILTAKNLANQLSLSESGFRLVINTGRNSGQTVDHLHLHLLGGKKLGRIA